MKKKKRAKLKPGINFYYFLTGIFLGIIVLFFFLNQNKFSRQYLGKVDDLVNSYIPPGAELFKPGRQKTEIVLLGNNTVKVPILLYHYIEYNQDEKDTIRTSLAVTPFWFEKQLEYLKDNDYRTITFTDLYNAIRKKGKLPNKPVILTFDDGYRDFYTDAFPILKKYNAKATLFIVPKFLDKQNYLFTKQLKEISEDQSHLVSVGAHTMSHPALTLLSKEQAYLEISESKLFIEKLLNKPVVVFNYPYGIEDNNVREIVKKAGFKIAVSTMLGGSHSFENILVLPRIRVGNYAGESFEQRLKIDD